jgi:phosphoglycolate phosphatase
MNGGAHVFLDLDGTLTDPRQGFLRCVRHAFERLGRAPPPEEAIAAHIGPPLEETFTALLGPDPATVARAVAFYRERYAAGGLFETAWYPGVEQAVRALAERATLTVVTSKPTLYAAAIVAPWSAARCFRAVHGCGLNGERADKRELIAHVLASEHIPAAGAAMVGDRAHDIRGARHNGVRGFGAGWGYGSPAELRGAGAAAIFATPAELAQSLPLPLP